MQDVIQARSNAICGSATQIDVPSEMLPLTYIRPLQSVEGEGYAVCTEQGEVMAVFASYHSAYFTARQFHLEPLVLH